MPRSGWLQQGQRATPTGPGHGGPARQARHSQVVRFSYASTNRGLQRAAPGRHGPGLLVLRLAPVVANPIWAWPVVLLFSPESFRPLKSTSPRRRARTVPVRDCLPREAQPRPAPLRQGPCIFCLDPLIHGLCAVAAPTQSESFAATAPWFKLPPVPHQWNVWPVVRPDPSSSEPCKRQDAES